MKLIATLEQMRDLPALVNAGCDEVLIAVKGMSHTALHAFTIQEMTYINEGAKQFGIAVSVLVNRMFHEDDIEEIEVFFSSVRKDDITSVYYGDQAVLDTATRMGWTDKLVYAPDTLLTSSEDIRTYLSFGIQSAMISPLLSTKELTKLTNEVPSCVMQIHGRTVLARSYRKLVSAWKDAYHKDIPDGKLTISEEKRDGRMPIYEDECGTLVYSDEVLASFTDFMKFPLAKVLVSSVNAGRMEHIEAVHAYKRIMNGEDGNAVYEEYRQKFPEHKLGRGYYDNETVK